MKKERHNKMEAGCSDDVGVTIGVTKQMHHLVESAAEYMGAPATPQMVWSEALSLGLQTLHGWNPHRGFYLPSNLRPKHKSEIYGAGYATAVLLAVEEQGLLPLACDLKVKLVGDGSEFLSCEMGHFTFSQRLKILVAGAVAEAKFTGVRFSNIWRNSRCKMAVEQAQEVAGQGLSIRSASESIRKSFNDPCMWHALVSLSRELRVNDTVDGIYCDAIFSQHLDTVPRTKGVVYPGSFLDELLGP